MAIDTRDKRSSCFGFANPWKFAAPDPDGSLAAQADRQHVAYSYSGILASGPPTTKFWTFARQRSQIIGGGSH